jgi:hypothetical protein
LYRDAGNFKNWGEVIFANINSHDIGYLERRARQVLIDHEFFNADKAGVPNLTFKEHIERLDHEWHEFHSFTPTAAIANDPNGRDVAEFIEVLRYAATI